MAVQATYNFKGIAIPNAYIRVERIFGGKKEGWNSLVAVYPTTPVAITNAEGESTYQEPVEKFNCGVPYDAVNMNAMELVYTKLMTDLSGVMV